jgi:hypothetical protein
MDSASFTSTRASAYSAPAKTASSTASPASFSHSDRRCAPDGCWRAVPCRRCPTVGKYPCAEVHSGTERSIMKKILAKLKAIVRAILELPIKILRILKP